MGNLVGSRRRSWPTSRRPGAHAESSGGRVTLLQVASELGRALRRDGRLDESTAVLDGVVREARSLGLESVLGAAEFYRAQTLLESGDGDGAREAATTASRHGRVHGRAGAPPEDPLSSGAHNARRRRLGGARDPLSRRGVGAAPGTGRSDGGSFLLAAGHRGRHSDLGRDPGRVRSCRRTCRASRVWGWERPAASTGDEGRLGSTLQRQHDHSGRHEQRACEPLSQVSSP